jgi:hypothetical protein
MSNSGITPNELWRLYYAWRVAQIEGRSEDDSDALKFEYLLFEGDPKFLEQLARLLKKETPIPLPWLPQDYLEKVRLAYVSFDPELHPTWENVKELAIKLYPELNGIDDSHWRKLRRQAGLSRLPGRGRGRGPAEKG